MSSPLTNDPHPGLREALRRLRAGESTVAEALARQALAQAGAPPA